MSRAYGTDHIGDLYFRYNSVATHAPSCSLAGTDTWEVSTYRRTNFDETEIKTTLRLICAECGTVAFVGFDGELSFESTNVRRIGYGSRPERVGELWLHPGPVFDFWKDRGPTAFYVTRTKERPREPGDVAGIVAWSTGPRGGVRWSAGIGCTQYGGVERTAEQYFTSRRAAVAWMAGQLAEPEPGQLAEPEQLAEPVGAAGPGSGTCSCGDEAGEHDVTTIANLASRFPCLRPGCGCRDYDPPSIRRQAR